MIKYKKPGKEILTDLFTKTGLNSNQFRKKKILGESQMQKLRDNEIIGVITLGKVCDLLECQPGDLIYNEIQKPEDFPED